MEGLRTRTDLQARLRTGSETWFHWLFDRLVATMGPADGGQDSSGRSGRDVRILELAAGTGSFWSSNAARIPRRWRVVLSDMTLDMLGEARGQLDGSPCRTAGMGILAADVRAIPSPARTFDAVLANGVFDFLPEAEREAAIRDVHRSLAAGCRLYAATGGQGHLAELESLVRPFVPDADYGGDPDAFGLENGAEQLGCCYSSVQRYTYEDNLVFAAAEPLLAYLLSEPQVAAHLGDRERAGLVEHVEVELAQQGEIRATEKKALFVARKA
jgi:hypothetical protein